MITKSKIKMKNIMTKSDLCTCCAEVEMRRSSRLLPAVMTLLGVAFVVAALVIKNVENLSTALLTVGVVVMGLGLFRLVKPRAVLVYTPTAEPVGRHHYAHPTERRERVENAIREGKTDLVAALDANQNAPLMSVVYKTSSGSFVAGQMYHYVPYEYEPLMEPVVIVTKKHREK